MSEDIILDNFRIQIQNPCTSWGDTPEKITIYNCEGTQEDIVLYRNSCHNQKIIAWLFHEGFLNIGTEFDLGTSNGNGSVSQVMSRIIGDCDTTEIRDTISSAPFEPKRFIKHSSSFNNKTVYCNRRETDSCYEMSDIVSFTLDEQDDGQNYYCPETDPHVISVLTLNGRVSAEYGTKKIDNQGDIYPNCIVNSADIHYLYIPCEHYLGDENNDVSPGYIQTGAFSGLTNLKIVRIDGVYGGAQNSHFGISDGADPFYGCENIQVVYCPDSSWINYFKQGYSSNKFPNLKYINGRLIGNI